MLLAVVDGLNPVFLVLFLIAIVLSALYMMRAIVLVFFGQLQTSNAEVHESPRVMSWPLVLLALLTVSTGFIALPLGGGFEGIGSVLFAAEHKPHAFELNVVWAGLGTVLALVGLGIGYRLYAGSSLQVDWIRQRFSAIHRILVNRYYMDHAYQWIVDRVVLRLSSLVAKFDRRIINDVGVNGSGLGVMEAGRRLRYHVTGLFADYGLAMVIGVGATALLLWLRS